MPAAISYEGTKPYIFISYAHRDTDRVLPVLQELCGRGYRIWYDDGIAPGSEWPENIAEHLNACDLTLAFISPNSIASDNCRREVTFALSKRKKFLAIVLEPTEMSLGMEMQLSAQQCIMKYGCATEEDFYRKLFSCPYLEPCLDPAAVQTAVPKQIPEKTPEKTVEKRRKQEKTRTKPEKKGSPILKWIPVIAVVLVLAVAGGIFLVNKMNRIQLTPTKVVTVKDTFVSLYNETVTPEMAQGINRMESLEQITFSQCTFVPGALAQLELPETVKYVSITDSTDVDTLVFLNRLSGLKDLILSNSGITDALLPDLGRFPLEELDLNGNPGVTDLSKLSGCDALQVLDLSGTGIADLSALEGLDLTRIYFSDTKVSDLTVLENMERLVTVVGQRSGVTDISGLSGLKDLSILDFSGCAVTDPVQQFQCLRLKQLHLSDTQVADLSMFSDCTVLQQVSLENLQMEDLSVLAKSVATLQILNLSGLETVPEALDFLSGCSTLKQVYLDGMALSDLDFLAASPELTHVSAVGCGLEDISGLSQATKLTMIALANNAIGDISPLINIAHDTAIVLDLGYNPLKDVSDLPRVRYRVLSIICEELDVSTIPQLEGNTIVLNYTSGIAESTIPEQTFTTYAMLNCPADQQVAMQDLINRFKLKLLENPQELIDGMLTWNLDYSFVLER